MLLNIYHSFHRGFPWYPSLNLSTYTPQQNGVGEHKNRLIIATTQTLLLHGCVP